MPVAPLDIARDAPWLQPDMRAHVEDRQVVESHLAVPTAEDVHVVVDDHCRVPETNLRLRKQQQVLRELSASDHCCMLWGVRFDLFAFDVAPAVGSDLVAVHV